MNAVASQVVVREARPDELLEVFALSNALRLESIWEPFTPQYQADYVILQFLNALYDPRQKLIVAEQDGALVGFCGASFVTHRFMPSVGYVAEWAIYVKPEHRGSGHGKQLWRAILSWGHALGAVGCEYGKLVHGGNPSHTRSENVWHGFHAKIKEYEHA